jgi:hypothetical protein
MKEAEENFELEGGSTSKLTSLTRLQNNRKTVGVDRGHVSPCNGPKAHFIDIILQLSAMHQPLIASRAPCIINSLVETSNMQKEIIEWKANNLPEDDDDNNEDKGEGKAKKLAYLGKKMRTSCRQSTALTLQIPAD